MLASAVELLACTGSHICQLDLLDIADYTVFLIGFNTFVPFSVVFVTSTLYLPYKEYSYVGRWSSFQHRRMSNATPTASEDLFSRSCLEQLKTPSSLAGGVLFVPFYDVERKFFLYLTCADHSIDGVSRTIVAPSLYIWQNTQSYVGGCPANTVDLTDLTEYLIICRWLSCQYRRLSNVANPINKDL